MKPFYPPVSDELVFPCDIDDTLLFEYASFGTNKEEDWISLDYYGTTVRRWISRKHVAFLKSLRARGYYIILWTGNGKQWADEVNDKLGLEDIVSQTMMKPLKYLDDLDCKEWMGKRIYLEYQEKK